MLHITYHFEFSDIIERILDRHEVRDFVRCPGTEGKDRDGKHFGNQVYPGNVAMVQAQVSEDRLEALLSDLREFRDGKEVHKHLQAVVLPIEKRL